MENIEHLISKMKSERNRHMPNLERKRKCPSLSDLDCAYYYVYDEVLIRGLGKHGYNKNRLIEFLEHLKNKENNSSPNPLVEDIVLYNQHVQWVIQEVIENTRNSKIGFDNVAFCD